MAGWIEDRWLKKRVNPKTGKRERTKLWGSKTKRYRVAGIPGVRSRSFDTADAAKSWLKTAGADSARGDFYDPRNGMITLEQYVRQTWWPTVRIPPTTKESMATRIFGHILPHMGAMPLAKIGPDEIKWWVTQAEQDIDVSTIRVTWRHFSKIMQAAKAAKRIPANPFRDPELKAPAVPKSKAKAWPRKRVEAVRANLGRRYRVLVDEAVMSGVRQGEAFGLSPGDLDGEELHIERQVIKTSRGLAFAPPKGNKTRVGPCPAALAEAVKAHMKEFPPVEVTLPWVDPDRPNMAWEDRPLRTVLLICTTPRGNAINRASFDDKQWKPALAAAGIIEPPEVEKIERPGKRPLVRIHWNMPREEGFHVTRHTFASVVLAGGETITKLAQWLGHSDPAFTLRTYVHFMPKAGRRGLAALAAWARGEDPDDADH
ncbi:MULTISPECIES: tyrosine-type recombinase/integrase [Streptomyces]|uniref:Tyrosine-type recombinase/integrase n=2 Tax=Streptomyces rimosus subsp. rimosus TaxID=132474 RepID=L8EUY4_STRR1|nr:MULTISPECIES: site-specific integrase [Streptomyces]MYT44873.1 tyrosine-type recombinase/integrase [Streptomyces sp. SID5471]KUJ43492.1 hypothetical protein ADK46_00990 [Streptomyces rimosus subsp. rimosus]QDA09896.1 site-specific integrase [Streptomyces rimosus]QEV81168.1 site-specific integrase [Streptomyces rimosus]QGY70360.1 tyrosine-type recombinase/integrase [Streptomyces rimosus R6-500]